MPEMSCGKLHRFMSAVHIKVLMSEVFGVKESQDGWLLIVRCENGSISKILLAGVLKSPGVLSVLTRLIRQAAEDAVCDLFFVKFSNCLMETLGVLSRSTHVKMLSFFVDRIRN
jgi:hypothetical protein